MPSILAFSGVGPFTGTPLAHVHAFAGARDDAPICTFILEKRSSNHHYFFVQIFILNNFYSFYFTAPDVIINARFLFNVKLLIIKMIL
jgi:hypothetical protein